METIERIRKLIDDAAREGEMCEGNKAEEELVAIFTALLDLKVRILADAPFGSDSVVSVRSLVDLIMRVMEERDAAVARANEAESRIRRALGLIDREWARPALCGGELEEPGRDLIGDLLRRRVQLQRRKDD
jgi:hypothetical protein